MVYCLLSELFRFQLSSDRGSKRIDFLVSLKEKSYNNCTLLFLPIVILFKLLFLFYNFCILKVEITYVIYIILLYLISVYKN